MSVLLKNNSTCLFQNRKSKLKKIFNLSKVQCSDYQLIGDTKIEEEVKINFINEISAKRNSIFLNNSSLKKQINITDPGTINNHTNNQQIMRKTTNISKIKSKKPSVAIISKNNTFRKNSTVSKNPIMTNNINIISDNQMPPTTDLLLHLYDKGMYDQLNPSHQRGTVKLTEKQKSKWKLSDYHPLLYASNIKNYHPFCFFYGTKYKDLVKENGETKYPEGKLVNYRDWQTEPDYTLNGIYKGIEINPKVGLVIVDPKVKKKYQGLVADIIIQLLKVPFGHHMCLNVRIFEPKCLEERLTNVFSYANKYLLMANDPLLDPYERFKIVITFIFSGLYIPAQQLKPFNPYVGETFQGELPNGAKVYCEQVTHKPLCVRFYMFYKMEYKLYGYFNFSVRSEGLGSTMYVCQQGPCNVEFPQLNEKITFNVPEIKIVNARNENGRANLYNGALSFVDIKNNYRAVIQFDFNKKKFHDIRGCTFKYNFPPQFKYKYDVEWPYAKKLKIEKLKSDPNYLEEIKGSWITELIIGNKQYWDVKAQIPEFIKPTKTCLPSDGRFREDLCWLYKSFYNAKNENERKIYENISQWWKVLMEDHNRWERKRRADYNEKLKKLSKKK
jgi:hypothetical protein